MRATIHVVSRRDYWPFAVAIRAAQREWLLRIRKPRPKERDLERQADELRALMADGPRRQRSWSRSSAAAGGWSGRGSTSFASRRRARGRSAARTSSRPPSAGSGRRTSIRVGARPPRPPLPGRVRSGIPRRHRAVGGDEARRRRARARAAAPSPLSRRTGRRASRPAASGTPGSRDARAGALPPDLGRRSARPRASHGRAAGEVPTADLPDQDAAVGRHVPAWTVPSPARGATTMAAFAGRRSSASGGQTTREVDDEAERLAAFHD